MWPLSLPDYKWPRDEARRWMRRLISGTLFHLAHAAGRIARLTRGGRPAILAIRTDGIGDAVLAEPMLRSLSSRFADHELHLWAPKETCELLGAAPYIQRRQAIPRGYKQGNLQLFRDARLRMSMGYLLGRWKFAAAAYLSHSPEPLGNWLLRSVRAKDRWYSSGDLENQFPAQRLATQKKSTHSLPVIPSPAHDLSRNAALARQWGGEIEQCGPTIHVDDSAVGRGMEQMESWRRVAAWLGAECVVGLMPVPSLAVKEYPAFGWAETASILWGHGIICALLGGPGDGPKLEEVSRRFAALPHLKMNQPLDLAAMSALIGSLDGMLSVDTGLAHVSLAQEVPTVVLVGGGHPGRFFPWPIGRYAAVLNNAMPCDGCRNRCHRTEPYCITRITPEQIAGSLANLLRRPAREPLRAVG